MQRDLRFDTTHEPPDGPPVDVRIGFAYIPAQAAFFDHVKGWGLPAFPALVEVTEVHRLEDGRPMPELLEWAQAMAAADPEPFVTAAEDPRHAA